MTAIFQVVMLSASLKRSSARPSESVSSEGCQTRVSGKYSRKRGVEVSAKRSDVPDFVTALRTPGASAARLLTLLPLIGQLSLRRSDLSADEVEISGASAVTVTVSVVPPG